MLDKDKAEMRAIQADTIQAVARMNRANIIAIKESYNIEDLNVNDLISSLSHAIETVQFEILDEYLQYKPD